MESGKFIKTESARKMLFGSLEERVCLVHDAVINEDLWNGNAVPFATFEDRVIVMNDEGKFFDTVYDVKDGLVKFGSVKLLSMEEIPASEAVSGLVEDVMDAMGDEKVLKESISGLVSMASGRSKVEETKSELKRLFSGGGVWRKMLEDNRDVYTKYGWDYRFGKPIMLKPRFEDIYEIDEVGLEEHRNRVMAGLKKVETHLGDFLDRASRNSRSVSRKTVGIRNEEDDKILSQIDSFSSDYVKHLAEIKQYVNSAARKAESGCVLCAAIIHDEIAKRFNNLELGERVIRKVSAQFRRNERP